MDNVVSLHTVFDTGGEIWSTLPYRPLFETNKGFSTRTFTQDANALFAQGGVMQEIPAGMPLRLWIEGTGGLAGVATDPTIISVGDDLDKAESAIPNTAIALANTRLRTGTRTTWDTDFAFPLDSFPSSDAPSTNLHGHDPSQEARIIFANDWANEWALTLLRTFPFTPIVLEGTVVGAGYSTAPSASTSQKAQFFLQEAFIVARNEWLGYEELPSLGIPVMPVHNFPTDTTDVFQRAVWNAVSLITPLDTMPIQGVVFRPLTGNSRERLGFYRTDIHPFFRK